MSSCSFQIALCEVMAYHLLSTESSKRVVKFHADGFATELIKGYMLSLPSGGREAATNLAKYCIITGFLFRGWVRHTKGEEGYPRLVEIGSEITRKREESLETLKPAERAKIEDVVRREGRYIQIIALKLQRDTGVA